MTDALVLAQAEGGLLRVTLNRPEKLNALSPDLLEMLRDVFETHAADAGLKAAVLRGMGDKSFAAGGDLRVLSGIRTLDGAMEMADHAKEMLEPIRRFPVPVIAVLNGDALGGGAELAMACDYRVAAVHARIGFVQGRLNISTAWGGGIDLMQRIGASRGLGLLCRSELLDCESAMAGGVIESFPREGQSLDDHLAEFLAPILRQKTQTLRAFKALARGVREGLPRTELYRLETRMLAEAWVHPDHWEAADKVLQRSKVPTRDNVLKRSGGE